MNKRRWYTLLIVMVGLLPAVSLFPEVAHAKTWSGKWGGKNKSTLDFLDEKQVKYCFKKDCVIKKYTGSEKGKIRFRWGRSRFTFEWNGQGYNGLYRAGSNRSSILLH